MVDSDRASGNNLSEHTVFIGYEGLVKFANVVARNRERRSTIDHEFHMQLPMCVMRFCILSLDNFILIFSCAFFR